MLVAAAAASDRKRCAAPGRYERRNGTDLLARAFDGPSFFGEGRWMNNNKYVLQPPCDLKEGDAFACAARLARNALDALAEAAGPLQERDVLTACADCALRPVRFDDALRRVAQRAPGQARKGLKGYFAARAPVQISHREENVLDLRTPEPRARRRKRRRPVLPPPVG